MKKLFIAVLTTFCSINVNAATYQVEIIIFEHLFPDSGGELWHSSREFPDLGKSIELITDGTEENNPSAFRLLRPSSHKLGGVWQELKFSKHYRPIMHIAWQQPGLGTSGAKAVRIRDFSKPNPESDTDQKINIDGTIRLRVTRFLHVDTDLIYFFNLQSGSILDASPETSTGGKTPARTDVTFALLKESRRLKLNEIHYFDHPLFGMFIRVNRLSGD